MSDSLKFKESGVGMRTAVTHFAVISFIGDPWEVSEDPTNRGTPPSIKFIAAGDYEFCRTALGEYLENNSLFWGEIPEVVERLSTGAPNFNQFPHVARKR